MNGQENEPLDFDHGLVLLNNSPAECRDLATRFAQLAAPQRATCPRCTATTVQIVSVQKKNLGAAMLAEWLLDSTAAGVAAGSTTVLSNACVACGFQWLPGSLPEALARLLSGQLGEDTRRHFLDRFRRREQELRQEAQARQQEQQKSLRTTLIVVALLAMLAVGLWIYSENFSPQARAFAEDLKRTDSWVACVLQEHPRNTAACGQPVSRASLNAWFENGHMDVLGNIPTRSKLESMSLDTLAGGRAAIAESISTARQATSMDKTARMAGFARREIGTIELAPQQGAIALNNRDIVLTQSLVRRVMNGKGQEVKSYSLSFVIVYQDGDSDAFFGDTLPLKEGKNLVKVFVNGVPADRSLVYIVK